MVEQIMIDMADKPVGYCINNQYSSVRCTNFIKMGKNKVFAYLVNYCYTNNTDTLRLYEDKIIFNIKNNWAIKVYIEQCYLPVKYRYTSINGKADPIISFKNTETLAFNRMVMSYDGLLISKIPNKVQKEYDNVMEALRNRKNMLARALYHRVKATERLDIAKKHKNIGLCPMDDVFKLNNVSHRREIIEHYGMDTIIKSLKHKVIDKDIIDSRPYELVSIAVPDNLEDSGYRDCLYLRMTNPSTGETHFEGVPNVKSPTNRWNAALESLTVQSALAWRDGEDTYNVPVVLT